LVSSLESALITGDVEPLLEHGENRESGADAVEVIVAQDAEEIALAREILRCALE
jgi:hypothetical protein